MYKRRILALLVICCCFITGFAVPQAMAETTVNQVTEYEAATSLKMLGMISGNDKGDFMLQSKLKRSEAAQFIVNMIGKNKYVNDNKEVYSSTIYKDVKKTDWFAASVGYCQQAGIIAVNDTFNPGSTVTEKQFLAMVIQALGYRTPDDFSWSTVYQKAYEIGLVNDTIYQTKTEDNKEFTRGNVVKIMYTALGLKPKDENMTLVQKMVYESTISYETAIQSNILKDEIVSKIIEIKPLNEQKIKVAFNEKIGTVNPENIQITDTASGSILEISSINQVDTELIIKTSKQVAARKYSVEIKKLTDYEGNTIPKVSGEFTGFTVVEVVSDLFKISKIEQKGANELNIYFTHPVNDNAANSAYYEIFENDELFLTASSVNTSVKVLPNNNGVTVTLKGRNFTAGREYTVKVSQDLISAYGVNFEAQTELSSFIAKDIQSVGFAIEQITGLSKNTIQVDFTMDINPIIAEQIYMYSITDPNNKQLQVTSAQMASGTGRSVILSINGSLDTTKTYNIMVNYMIDATGQYTINTQSYAFTGYVPNTVEFQVYSVTPVDTSSISIYFSKPLSDKSLSDLSNFSLLDSSNYSTKVIPTKVVVSPEDPSSIRLYFSKDKKLLSNKTYVLRVSSKLTDYTGYSLTGQTDFPFDTYGLTDTGVNVEKAVSISRDTIKVVFNKEIAIDSTNVFTGNYSIDYYENGNLVKKAPIAITYINSKIIVLKFDKLPEGVEYYFNYKEIKDIGGEVHTNQQTNAVKVAKGV